MALKEFVVRPLYLLITDIPLSGRSSAREPPPRHALNPIDCSWSVMIMMNFQISLARILLTAPA
jgi:hypothetical protein